MLTWKLAIKMKTTENKQECELQHLR